MYFINLIRTPFLVLFMIGVFVLSMMIFIGRTVANNPPKKWKVVIN